MTDKKISSGANEGTGKVMPMLFLEDAVLFPGCAHELDVSGADFIDQLRKTVRGDRQLFIISDTKITDGMRFSNIGVVASITQLLRRPDMKSLHVRVMPEYRAFGELVGEPTEGCNCVKICKVKESDDAEQDAEAMKLFSRITDRMIPELCEFKDLNGFFNNYSSMKGVLPISQTVDSIAYYYPFELSQKQDILNSISHKERVLLLYKALKLEMDFLRIDKEIEVMTMDNMEMSQRDYYLREKLHAIYDELGEGDSPESESDEFRNRINELELSDDVRKALLKECGRLSKLPFGTPESAVIRGYLDVCLSIPWSARTEDSLDVAAAKKRLDNDHYGMEKVKERILELIAVRSLAPDIKGQIICLAGPPGVGKTSIARSIAEAMGRRYMRISLGGVRDEAEIRGHRKTYLGSMPGRIINAVIKSEVKNPLILLDEIDKLSSDSKGDPTSALLEVLDPEQNKAFVDHFLELPVDLSEVIFITTANDVGAIPAPLYDRMEIIELPSYTHEEKAAIASKYLVPKQMKNCGLTSKMLKISDTAISKLINDHTREAGVRNLEREIGSLCRKCAKRIASGEAEKISVTTRNLESIMGKPKFKREELPDVLTAGMANGLAWTSIGGEMLEIEAAVMEGSGKLELTGQLGEVMQESAKAAMSCIRQRAEKLGIDPDYYKNKDIHMHFPEGAVPKDGPSAGITIATAAVSALTGIPVRGDVAMTGEITLCGRVLAIGGLREKSMAALRHGIKTVIIPAANEPDISEFSETVKQNITFVPVKSIEEVFETAFSKPVMKND